MKKVIIFISLITIFVFVTLFTIDRTHSIIKLKDANAKITIKCDPPSNAVCAEGTNADGSTWKAYGHARIIIE